MKYFLAALAALFAFGCADITFNRTDTGMLSSLKVKNAGSVSMYVSTDGYTEHKAELKKNRWTVALPYADEMTYFITVDGVQTLPKCDMKEYDDFGGQLCVYEVQK